MEFSFSLYRKEITALQAENYSLERQLFSYQKSIAYAHGTTGSAGGSVVGVPIGRNSTSSPAVGGPVDDVPYECGVSTNHRPFLDRGVSTDTEYA